MASKGSQQLINCRNELSSIIRELKALEHDIRNNFTNVGNVQCADSIKSVINKYESALRTLNSVSPSALDRLKDAADATREAFSKR